jgi:hypothetical protein
MNSYLECEYGLARNRQATLIAEAGQRRLRAIARAEHRSSAAAAGHRVRGLRRPLAFARSWRITHA